MTPARSSHRLAVNRQVIHLKEFRLVEDEFLTTHASDVVDRCQFDGIARACFFAHAAVDAAELIDVELLWILFAIRPRALFGLDVNAVRWARSLAHEACHTADASVFILVQAMNASEVRLVNAAVLDIAMLAALLWVLEYPQRVLVGTIAAHVLEGVAQGGAQALEHVHHIEALGAVELLGSDVENFVVADGHGGGILDMLRPG